MKPEPPQRAGRPASNAAARLAALLAEVEQSPPVPPGAAAEHANGTAGSAVRVDGRAPDGFGVVRSGESATVERPGAVLAPTGPVPSLPPIAPDRGAGGDAASVVPPPARRRSVWTVASGVAMAVLIGAVPVLGVIGARTVLHSRAGKVTERNLDPHAPGYAAIVEPTPTALVIQKDADGRPLSATVLALGTGDTGGSILFVPLDTNLVKPALYIDRLRTSYAIGGDALLASLTGKLLGIGFDRVITLDDGQWAQLVAPVAPLAIANPTDVAFGPMSFPVGPLQLTPEQVGPYLGARRLDEDDLDRLARQKLVWQAWLAAIAGSPSPNAIPNTTSGIGPFLHALSAGDVGIATLDVDPAAVLAPDGSAAFQPDLVRVREQVTDAVPAPVSPGLGQRYLVRLQNGVDGEPIPDELIRKLVIGGAQINVLGNATTFGAKTTTIQYHDRKWRDTATAVRLLLGGGKIQFDAQSNDTVDLVIVLGEDALGAAGDDAGG